VLFFYPIFCYYNIGEWGILVHPYNFKMKRLFSYIIIFLFFVQAFFLSTPASAEPIKVLGINYDNSSSLINISTKISSEQNLPREPLKFIRLDNPNRIYFDINDSILLGEKQHLVFEKSIIKEIRLAQFETDPNKIVRAVITFEEDFDVSNIKLYCLDNNIIVQIATPKISNDYFNTIYNEKPIASQYSNITVNSQAIKKVNIPVSEKIKAPQNVIDDIQRAFENSTLSNSDGQTYDSVVTVEHSSDLKLRTKYFINQYLSKNQGILVSGFGQISTNKNFYLKEPNRLVIDLPNTYVEKSIRNKEIQICPDGSCKDTAKIGQFEHDIARIVITSDNTDKYLPIYSQDSQSLFLVNTDKLNHTSLVSNVSNINKAFVRRIDNKTNELILSFSSPIVHSILRTEDSLNLFLFNVKSYNEQDIVKTLNGSYYNRFTLSLLPQIGVKAGLPIGKNDIVKIEQSIDSKALKITITRGQQDLVITEKPVKKNAQKGKIVIDAGHGGTDYGAIREGINEKDITLDITQRVSEILRSKGYTTALVRNDDTFVSLEDRVEFSEKEHPEVFVSIHVNSAVSTEPNGIETHWYHDYSKDFAEIVHKHMVKELPSAKDRGLFKSKFYVINHTTVPAILCEIGFLSNEQERNELITENRKQKTAKAIANGIIEYLKRIK